MPNKPADPGHPADGGAGPPGGPASEEAARLICLRLLATGPRTRAQLARGLRRRRVPDEVADSVLGRFTEVGLIDDAAFARAWVESRRHSRGLAGRLLAAELHQRGVPAEDVSAAVGSLRPQDELDAARELVARRLPATRGRPVPARTRQLVGLLARKGYPPALAFRVVREALEHEGGGESGWDLDLTGLEDAAADGDDWAAL